MNKYNVKLGGEGRQRKFLTRNDLRQQKAAFTLVELLVVIAIIGMLIALLLPAVQAAREAARRSSCSNNQKQLGLALHNHEDARKMLPYGGWEGDVWEPEFTGGNWRSGLLPYMEQSAVFDQLGKNYSSFESKQWGAPVTFNVVYDKLILPLYRCPSTGNEALLKGASTPLGAYWIDGRDLAFMTHDYVGVMGAYPDPAGRNEKCRPYYLGGFVSNSGMLVSVEKRGLKDAVDGTSNTLIVIEQSGTYQGRDIRSSYGGGWTGSRYTVPTAPLNGAGVLMYPTGMITLAWAINAQSVPDIDISNYPNDWGPTIIPSNVANSFHTGVVSALRADGSVSFLSNSLDVKVLTALGCRDDGKSVSP